MAANSATGITENNIVTVSGNSDSCSSAPDISGDNGGAASDAMFDRSLLASLDIGECCHFEPPLSVQLVGVDLQLRPLAKSDYDKGFVDLLGQLTTVGEISRQQFDAQFERMRSAGGCYYPLVLEDTALCRVVGAATLVVEHKFIHACAVRGRLEDVVVSDQYRGRQLGKLLIATVTVLARSLGCYKLTLDCRDEMLPFYSKMGFVCEPSRANFMTRRFC